MTASTEAIPVNFFTLRGTISANSSGPALDEEDSGISSQATVGSSSNMSASDTGSPVSIPPTEGSAAPHADTCSKESGESSVGQEEPTYASQEQASFVSEGKPPLPIQGEVINREGMPSVGEGESLPTSQEVPLAYQMSTPTHQEELFTCQNEYPHGSRESVPGCNDEPPPASRESVPACNDEPAPAGRESVPACNDEPPPASRESVPACNDDSPPASRESVPACNDESPPACRESVPACEDQSPSGSRESVPAYNDVPPPASRDSVPACEGQFPSDSRESVHACNDEPPPASQQSVPACNDESPSASRETPLAVQEAQSACKGSSSASQQEPPSCEAESPPPYQGELSPHSHGKFLPTSQDSHPCGKGSPSGILEQVPDSKDGSPFCQESTPSWEVGSPSTNRESLSASQESLAYEDRPPSDCKESPPANRESTPTCRNGSSSISQEAPPSSRYSRTACENELPPSHQKEPLACQDESPSTNQDVSPACEEVTPPASQEAPPSVKDGSFCGSCKPPLPGQGSTPWQGALSISWEEKLSLSQADTPPASQLSPSACEDGTPPVCQEPPPTSQKYPTDHKDSPSACKESRVCQDAPSACKQSPSACQASLSAHQEPPPASLEKQQSLRQGESTATIQGSPAYQDGPSSVCEEPPSVPRVSSAACQEEQPSLSQGPACGNGSPFCQESPSVCQKAHSACQESPTIIKGTPACEDGSPVCQESPSASQESPSACEKDSASHSEAKYLATTQEDSPLWESLSGKPRLRQRRHTYPDHSSLCEAPVNGYPEGDASPTHAGVIDHLRHRSGPLRWLDGAPEKPPSLGSTPKLEKPEKLAPDNGDTRALEEVVTSAPLLVTRRKTLYQCRPRTKSADAACERSRTLEVALVRIDHLPAYRKARRNCPALCAASACMHTSSGLDAMESFARRAPSADVRDCPAERSVDSSDVKRREPSADIHDFPAEGSLDTSDVKRREPSADVRDCSAESSVDTADVKRREPSAGVQDCSAASSVDTSDVKRRESSAGGQDCSAESSVDTSDMKSREPSADARDFPVESSVDTSDMKSGEPSADARDFPGERSVDTSDVNRREPSAGGHACSADSSVDTSYVKRRESSAGGQGCSAESSVDTSGVKRREPSAGRRDCPAESSVDTSGVKWREPRAEVRDFPTDNYVDTSDVKRCEPSAEVRDFPTESSVDTTDVKRFEPSAEVRDCPAETSVDTSNMASCQAEAAGGDAQASNGRVEDSSANVRPGANDAGSSSADVAHCAGACKTKPDHASSLCASTDTFATDEFRELGDGKKGPHENVCKSASHAVVHDCELIVENVDPEVKMGVEDSALAVNDTKKGSDGVLNTLESRGDNHETCQLRTVDDASVKLENCDKSESLGNEVRTSQVGNSDSVYGNDHNAAVETERESRHAKRLRRRSVPDELHANIKRLKRHRKDSSSTDSKELLPNGVEEPLERSPLRRSSRVIMPINAARRTSLEDTDSITDTRETTCSSNESAKSGGQIDDDSDEEDSKPLAFLCGRHGSLRNRSVPKTEDGSESAGLSSAASAPVETEAKVVHSGGASREPVPAVDSSKTGGWVEPKEEPPPYPDAHQEDAAANETEPETKEAAEEGNRGENNNSVASSANDEVDENCEDDSAPDSPPEATISPPVLDARRKRYRRLNEAQKLFLPQDCHKMEILSTKLRHTPGRLSGAAAANATTPPRPSIAKKQKAKKRSAPPVLVPNGDSDEGSPPPRPPARKRRRLLDLRESESPRPSTAAVSSPLYAGSESSEGPPHLEPEVSLTPPATPRRRGRGRGARGGGLTPRTSGRPPRDEGRSARGRGVRGVCRASRSSRGGLLPRRRCSDSDTDASAPELHEAAAEMSVVFTFELAPLREEWFRTFARQEDGDSAVDDWSGVATGGPAVLPYQMSQEELYPAHLVPGGGRPRPARMVTLPDRWLPPLPAPSVPPPEPAPTRHSRRQPRRKRPAPASPIAIVDGDETKSVDELNRVLASLGVPGGSDAAAVSPNRADTLTAWSADMPAPGLDELLYAERDSAEPAHDAEPDTPSRPPSSLSSTASVCSGGSTGSTDSASASVSSSSHRRKPAKRRKNLTGWPRAKYRKHGSLLMRAVNRAAAAAASEHRDSVSRQLESPAQS